MSIGSIASNTSFPPYAARSGTGGAWGAFPPSPADTGRTAQGSLATARLSPDASGTGASAAGPVSAFQQLSSDIQAMLLQAQGGTAAQATTTTGAGGTSTSTGVGAIGATTAVTPAQQLATDIQSILAQLQGNQSASSANGQTATASQAGASGEARPHHHHHHHEGGSPEGGDMAAGSGDTTASSTTATSAATTSGRSAATTSASSNDRAVSQAFAADIMQALQAYGSASSTATAPGLTA